MINQQTFELLEPVVRIFAHLHVRFLDLNFTKSQTVSEMARIINDPRTEELEKSTRSRPLHASCSLNRTWLERKSPPQRADVNTSSCLVGRLDVFCYL